MKEERYKELRELPSDKLYEYVTQKDSSEEKFAAIDILEERKMKPMLETSQAAAKSAKSSAIAAGVLAFIAIVSLVIQVLDVLANCSAE